MTTLQHFIENFQNLVAIVPAPIQPLIVMLAGAVPFIEGEVAAIIGIVGGLHLVVAAIAAAVGNFIAVSLIVLLTSRARTAVVDRTSARVEATVGAGTLGEPLPSGSAEPHGEAPSAKPESKGRVRFKTWLVRFGVPGASILGPLAIPTHFMSAILVAGGTPRGWVLLWQGVSIVLWTSVATISMWAALTFVVGV